MVSKAYQRFDEPSLLDQLYDPPFSPPPAPVHSEPVALLQALRIPQPAPLRDNAGYRSNYTSANAQDQTDSSPFIGAFTATIANRRVTILKVVQGR